MPPALTPARVGYLESSKDQHFHVPIMRGRAARPHPRHVALIPSWLRVMLGVGSVVHGRSSGRYVVGMTSARQTQGWARLKYGGLQPCGLDPGRVKASSMYRTV